MQTIGEFYPGKRVLVTGHTGFKGSWLCEWLLALGAETHGYALDPQPHELLFSQLGMASRLASDTRADLSDRIVLNSVVKKVRPDIILHLAAQPLVRLSYEIPLETFATNVMGTANVLEAVRVSGNPCTVISVTTDKCYENREWLYSYREEDAMGGHDPYSASKGAAELVISSYRRSFFHSNPTVALASARAGNVIGGGDWALDRIIPDCIRALRAGHAIPVRNKIATRPWQHVLEPLSGYLWLAARLEISRKNLAASQQMQGGPLHPDPHQRALPLAGPFNFGPAITSNRTVADLVRELLSHTGGNWTDASDPAAVHEASKLNLAIDKAFHLLDWQPVWDFQTTIMKTAQWYIGEGTGASPRELTHGQIQEYTASAVAMGLPWAMSQNE